MTLIELLDASPPLFLGIAGLIGLFVGSFLNVVIHRLPLMMERDWAEELEELRLERTAQDESPGVADEGGAGAVARGAPAPASERAPFNLAVPRSHCPSCDSPIAAWQNIPVLSWLLLRGRCANCSASISVRYPLVEAATALLSLVVAWHFGPTLQCAVALPVTWFLVSMSMIDIDTYLLPDTLTLPLMWIGLLASLFPVFADVREALIGAAAGYLVLWSIYWLFKLVTGKEGMGYGDFKLLAALGALLGVQSLPLIILLSSLVGAAVGVTLILTMGRDRSKPIPFGPYLAAAGWIAMLWGEELSSLYLNAFVAT